MKEVHLQTYRLMYHTINSILHYVPEYYWDTYKDPKLDKVMGFPELRKYLREHKTTV